MVMRRCSVWTQLTFRTRILSFYSLDPLAKMMLKSSVQAKCLNTKASRKAVSVRAQAAATAAAPKLNTTRSEQVRASGQRRGCPGAQAP